MLEFPPSSTAGTTSNDGYVVNTNQYYYIQAPLTSTFTDGTLSLTLQATNIEQASHNFFMIIPFSGGTDS